jgi:hypothetical protein
MKYSFRGRHTGFEGDQLPGSTHHGAIAANPRRLYGHLDGRVSALKGCLRWGVHLAPSPMRERGLSASACSGVYLLSSVKGRDLAMNGG